MHPCVTWEIIQNNPEMKWDWYNISLNPNITPMIRKNNPNNNSKIPSDANDAKIYEMILIIIIVLLIVYKLFSYNSDPVSQYYYN